MIRNLNHILHILDLTKLKLQVVKYIGSNNQFKGTVIANTNITAAPKPTAVVTFLDTAKIRTHS